MKYNPIKISPNSWTNIDEKLFFFDCPELSLNDEIPFILIEKFGGEKEDFTSNFWLVFNKQYQLWITFK